MTRERWIALFRYGFAVLGLVGLAAQYIYNVANIPDYKPANFFSFFTVESNIIAMVTLFVAAGYAWRGALPTWVQYLRGAATIYMTVTGITYSLLLRNVEVDTAVPWVNLVLHYIIPIVMIIDWLVDLPPFRIRVRSAMVWLAYPLLYLGYSLIRGPIVDWYPYPFLDPRPAGYMPVIVISIAIAVGALLLALLMSWTTRLRVSFVRNEDAAAAR
ncbi:MAG: Pr6Pr family membrane protein [Terrimesophilobacter sp.]